MTRVAFPFPRTLVAAAIVGLAGCGWKEPPTLQADSAQPGDLFRDCPACPRMVVVPAGTFTMGSPRSEEGRSGREGPRRTVTIASPFAAGLYEVTFAEWDACVRAGGCGAYRPDDRGRRTGC